MRLRIPAAFWCLIATAVLGAGSVASAAQSRSAFDHLPITREKFQKLLALIAQHGKDIKGAPAAVKALQLPSDRLRVFSTQDLVSGEFHGVYVDEAHSHVIFDNQVSDPDPETVLIYCDSSLNILRAVIDAGKGQFEIIKKPAEASDRLRGELEFWNKAIE
jgi:hypothetical protein